MEPFLLQVAKALLREHPQGLRDVAVVLPSQRAGLYLRKWIAQEAGRALWSPQLYTTGTFMQELAGLRPLANEELLFEGYEAYRKVEGTKAQALGDFLQWGGTALADISEADAHLVNLDTYYRDLRLWENIEWTFKDEPLSKGQDHLLRYWAMVGRLHAALNGQLLELGAGTTGLIERMALERGKDHLARWQAVWFTGLNAFTKAQEGVVRLFHGKGLARMAWDADRYYVDDPVQEAGMHLRKAMAYFGKGVIAMEDGLGHGRARIEAVRAPNNAAQAWCAAELLKQATPEERTRTAVVLADESLLPPLLEALPKDLGPVNVTMGLAAAQLPVGSFLEALHQLHAGLMPGQGFFHKDVGRFLGHPFLRAKGQGHAMDQVLARVRGGHRVYWPAAVLREAFATSGAFPEAEGIFVEVDDVRGSMPGITAHALAWAMRMMEADAFAREQIFQASLVLQRVHQLLGRYHHELDAKAYASMFRRILSGARLGFHGEPLMGVQVMGMLEARALDAERVIVLGAKEGVLPAGNDGRSYIPFELRKAVEMPLRDDTEAVQAYNFLRMLQRCDQAALIWPDEDEGGGPSRFIMQLQHELYKRRGQHMVVRDAEVAMVIPPPVAIRVDKDASVLEALRKELERGLSPSALGDWLRCPLDFHFKRVLRLKEYEAFDARIAPNVLGEALHNTVEGIYERWLGKPLEADGLEKAVGEVPDRLHAELTKEIPADQLDRGQPMFQLHMALHAARRFLRNEAEGLRSGAVVTVLAQEMPLEAPLGQAAQAIGSPVKIKGRLDRVDRCNGMLRILDLKTGKVAPRDLEVAAWDLDAFRGEKRYAAQLMMYSWLYLTGDPTAEALEAGILPLRNAESHSPMLLTVGGLTTITRKDLPAIAKVLAQAVQEMMDPAIPVEHDPESKYCKFCLASGAE